MSNNQIATRIATFVMGFFGLKGGQATYTRQDAMRIAVAIGATEQDASEAFDLVEAVSAVAEDSDILAAARARLDVDGMKVVSMLRGLSFDPRCLSPKLRVAAELAGGRA